MSSKTVPVDASEIEKHLVDLRRSYVEALPKQRLSIAKQRINNPEHDPNRLIAYVSAVEGFARSLCMHQRGRTKQELSAVYPEYERRGPQALIGEYLSAKSLGTPRDLFGEDTWKLFGYAVDYRNLLAHECTYLGQDRSPTLIDACRKVLQTLANAEGLNADDI
jgi:hypothetical protein